MDTESATPEMLPPSASLERLELTWVGKRKRREVVEPRLLIEEPAHGCGDVEQGTLPNGHPWHGNMLIHGDNLLALQALAHNFAGAVKCIYIDPPYNTGNAFEHYNDALEHSLWLNLMRERLELLRLLLAEEGSIWISIDSDECHYLKVLCDEVFGRSNFVDEVVWQRSYAPVNLKKTLSRCHDYILVYAKHRDKDWCLNKLPRTAQANARYANPDNDPRGDWKPGDCSVGPAVEANIYPITTPAGRVVMPPQGRSWVFSSKRFQELVADNRIWFGDKGQAVPQTKRFLSEVKDGIVAMTLWPYSEVGHTQDAKREIKALNLGDVFATPKPERLIARILTLATQPGDLVLDSFLGSGTTAAVAHKMRRRWIGVEMGLHAYTHCAARLRLVVGGHDAGGVTHAMGWTGGGGFRFYRLAPTLINCDSHGRPIINSEYDAPLLAAAMALHEGYEYAPDPEKPHRQGRNAAGGYIMTTTSFVTVADIDQLSTALEAGEQLLLCCEGAQADCAGRCQQIEVKKIPQALLGRCRFGRDDYSLHIVALPAEAWPEGASDPYHEELGLEAPEDAPECPKASEQEPNLFS